MEHPDWEPGVEWAPPVASTCVESGGEVVLLDPLAPPDDAREAWARLDARPPTAGVAPQPAPCRAGALFVRRSGARALGPDLFSRTNTPEPDLEPFWPGSELPGGL